MINKTTRLGTAAFLRRATVRHDHEPQPGQPVRDEAGYRRARTPAPSARPRPKAPPHHEIACAASTANAQVAAKGTPEAEPDPGSGRWGRSRSDSTLPGVRRSALHSIYG